MRFKSYDNVKIHKYTTLEPNIPSGSRVMSIFTKRAQPAKMMLGEASSQLSYQWLDNIKIHKYTKIEQNNHAVQELGQTNKCLVSGNI